MSRPELRVLMVCLGNICRSPTAEGVLRAKLAARGLGERVEVDSAGTGDWHVGEPPDHRAQQHARRRGYEISALRGRQVCAGDFERFDLVLAMDWENVERLEAQCPPVARPKLRRLMEFADSAVHPVVPDPWAGGAAEFEHALDLIEAACEGLVAELAARLKALPPRG